MEGGEGVGGSGGKEVELAAARVDLETAAVKPYFE